MLHLTRLVKNEARLSPYEAHCSNAAMYEAPLGSGMKRSLGRLHFLPKAKMVPGAGIEPARPLRTTDFKSVASAYSAIRAYHSFSFQLIGLVNTAGLM